MNNQQIFRLYFHFVPKLIMELTNDYYQKIESGSANASLLKAITIRELQSGTTLPAQNLNPHLLENYQRSIFPQRDPILSYVPNDRKQEYKNTVLVQLSHFLHPHYLRRNLYWVLPHKDETEEHYRYRARIYFLFPLINRILNELEKVDAMKMAEIAEKITQDKTIPAEFYSLTAQEQAQLERFFAHPISDIVDPAIDPVAGLLQPGQTLQFPDFSLGDQQLAMLLSLQRRGDGLIDLQSRAYQDGQTAGTLVVQATLNNQEFHNLPSILTMADRLHDRISSRGATIVGPLTYHGDNHTYEGKAMVNGKPHEFLIPAQELTSESENLADSSVLDTPTPDNQTGDRAAATPNENLPEIQPGQDLTGKAIADLSGKVQQSQRKISQEKTRKKTIPANLTATIPTQIQAPSSVQPTLLRAPIMPVQRRIYSEQELYAQNQKSNISSGRIHERMRTQPQANGKNRLTSPQSPNQQAEKQPPQNATTPNTTNTTQKSSPTKSPGMQIAKAVCGTTLGGLCTLGGVGIGQILISI